MADQSHELLLQVLPSPENQSLPAFSSHRPLMDETAWSTSVQTQNTAQMASMGQLAPGEAQYLPPVHDPLQYQNASTQTDEPAYTGTVIHQHVTHTAQEMEPDV